MWRPTYLPLGTSLMLACALITTYTMCVKEGHCEAILPTISKTGRQRPESCIFGLAMSTAGWLSLLIYIIRHKYTESVANEVGIDIHKLNHLSSIFKFITVVGMWIVACFQDPPPTAIVHEVGALTAFGGGIVYMTLDMLISHRLYPHGSTKGEVILRTICAVWLWLGILASVAFRFFPQNHTTSVASNATEWALWFGLDVAIASFSIDFSRCLVGMDFSLLNFNMKVKPQFSKKTIISP